MGDNAWTLDTPAPVILSRLHFAYPVVLLVFFLVTFMSYSILAADQKRTTTEAPVTGPGGKPLPRNKRRSASISKGPKPDFSPAKKSFFKWTSVALILTFLANAVLVILHVLVARADGWWCGKHVAVSPSSYPSIHTCLRETLAHATDPLLTDRWFRSM